MTRRRGRRALAGVLALVAATALPACIGTISQGELTTEVQQQRGGGVTSGLVDDAIDAVADELGQDPLTVHSITATLAQVTVVVPAADGSGREAWTYGTSGLYGGKGLEGPVVADAPAQGPFTVRPGDWDIGAGAATARRAAGPGVWVESVTVARPAEGADPVADVAVGGADQPVTVVVDATGAVVPEGPR